MEELTLKKPLATLSRRDFIKLLGGSALGFAIALSGLDKLSLPNNNPGSSGRSGRGGLFREAYALPGPGTWTPVNTSLNTSITAIHVAMLYNEKILNIAGSSFNKPPPAGWPNQWQVYNPASSSPNGTPQNTNDDQFCCHPVQLPDGKIFIAGGTGLYDQDPDNCNQEFRGIKKTWVYDPASGTNGSMALGPDMKEGRWYPTMINLADGRVAIFVGDDQFGGNDNQLVEFYNPTTNQIQSTTASGVPFTSGGGAPSSYQPIAQEDNCQGDPTGGQSIVYTTPTYSLSPTLGIYPRMHLMPSGLIFKVGFDTSVRAWNPTNSTIGTVSSGQWFLSGTSTSQSRAYGNSFLLPLENESTATEKGRIVIAGGGGSSPTNSAQLLNFTGPTSFSLSSTTPGPLNIARKFASQIILPDGTCMIFGGTSGGQSGVYIYQPEALNPDNLPAGWDDSPPLATVPRTYHSTSLLLPDGRVWTAGGTPSSNGNGEKRVQYYNPWYMTASRPTITSVTNVSSSYGSAGGTITISTPDAQQLDATRGLTGKPNTVSLVRLNAVTHHFEPNQRLVWLPILSRTSNSVVVQSPLNANLAPPGYYMIHVLKDGVPSAGKIIKIPGTGSSDQTTPTLTILTPSAAQLVTGPSGNVAVTVTGTSSDAGSGINVVEVAVDSGSYSAATNTGTNFSTWSKNVTITTSGSHTIKARATDNTGNTSSISIPITVAFV